MATKILARNESSTGLLDLDVPPTRAEVEEAKVRLQTGFSFIGLTEEWNLSICLFNTMFNQKCQSLQFFNSRPTSESPSRSMSVYDVAELNGWTDPYDNELWDIAVKMFEEALKKYNVSESSCEPCWSDAGVL